MPPLIIDRAVYLSHSGRDKSLPYRIYFGNKPPPGLNREGVYFQSIFCRGGIYPSLNVKDKQPGQ